MDFQGIRKNKVEAVFHACLQGTSVTRLGIAENTGLSVMTVGKIVDKLAEAGVLSQQLPRRNCAGRRTRVIKLKNDLRFAVYSLSEARFSLHILDLSLKEKGVYKYKPESTLMISDELARFYEDSYSYITANSKLSKFIGTGILVPGTFSEETGFADLSFSRDKLMCNIRADEYKESFPGKQFIISDKKVTTLKYLSQTNPKGTSMLAFFINSTLECCYFRAGDSPDRIHIGECGNLPYFSGTTVNEVLRQTGSPEEQADILSRLIVTLIVCTVPEKLVLTGNRFSSMDIFTDLIKQRVLYLCKASGIRTPDVVSKVKEHSPVVGISSELREMWFYKEILESH